MDAFFERLVVGAATIDELLSDEFETVSAQAFDTDLASRRLQAWARSAAAGDPSLFAQRLARDGLTAEHVMARFAGARRKPALPSPAWIDDAVWIAEALQSPAFSRQSGEPCAFEQLLAPVAERAGVLLWSSVDAKVADNLTAAAKDGLRQGLLRQLSELAAPALYERFAAARKAAGATGSALYDRFVADMKSGGLRQLFADKPVLLRLLATLARQWLEATREFVVRLDADLPVVRGLLPSANAAARVANVEGDLSDPHNGGRSVRIVTFDDGGRVVYKPKDLRVDVAWYRLVEGLNHAPAPIALRPARAIACTGYGWSEFVAHGGCTDQAGCERFFRRAGAWLALFHCFAANDMHQENLIAAGDQPVPIDLETVLQAPPVAREAPDPEDEAHEAATAMLANSVMTVGLLPAYARSPDNKVFAIGGMTADWGTKTKIAWENINSDAMRPTRARESAAANPNLPHVAGRYFKFADHIDVFLAGFRDYARFLLARSRESGAEALLDGFAGLPVRRVLRPTRFYAMLLQRLRNYHGWDDGVTWSAQADFIARLADWDRESDPLWPAVRAERKALLALNVPHFVSPSDGDAIADAAGFAMRTTAQSGLARARERVARLDEREIDWQIEVVRENTSSARGGSPRGAPAMPVASAVPTKEVFVTAADRVADELGERAIRRGPGAAWIGLDWLGDAEVFQLVCLGPDLYNGEAGIALFFAAHAAVAGSEPSAALARAGVARLRKQLKSRGAARMARAIGVGGATGLGSIVYALAAMAKCLRDHDLLADAHAAAALFTDELIAADKLLDVIGGSAGAILGLLRLYRDGGSTDVLARAVKCGEHLLAQDRIGPQGRRCWIGQGLGPRALNGMSHGAAGFAYALASLAAASGRAEFAQAASECLAYEDSNYDDAHKNWPDLRASPPSWPSQWCHGAPGIGLARIAMARHGTMDADLLTADVRHAVEGAERGWPGVVDTLCCGTLGSVEFLCEAATALDRADLAALAARRLAAVLNAAAGAGDFRWNSGRRQFNLGLFRGLAGVGYTALRRVDRSLPNVLIWE